MASSSSSTPSSQSPKRYDVFISFRGEDTRFNFTSHLHEALRSKQIETYIDYILEKGDEVWPSLEKAIEDSTLFLVIFSENYASSTWCLKELTKISECSKNQGNLVMPVFYRVNPSDVRKQSESYQKAFEEHERKSINKQQLQKWREALTHAANLSGWHFRLDRNEAELITEIVKCVTLKLDWMYRSEENPKGLIGIDKRMAVVESLLYKDSNGVRCIGIWGMGGIGKTTLAQALFDKLRFTYEDGFCFLKNVREESKKSGIYALKEKLILTLLGEKESHIGSRLDAISPFARRRLRQKKVFIVIDDVDDPKQLEDLVGRHDWFGSGSKILITTRDKQVVRGKEVDDIYRVEALNPDEAFDLFSITASRNDYADPEIRVLAKRVAQYADGNLLALKVLGSLLNGKNQEAWESLLEKLKKLPSKEINDILKLSFEGLDDDEEKNIFLHIVCFFNHYNVDDVKNWLDKCGYSTFIGLERLEDRALIDTRGGIICMHHLIKEMGRQIVREKLYPQMRVRIWNSNQIIDKYKKDMESMDIEGIVLEDSEALEETSVIPQVIRSMHNLRFLIFHKDFNVNKLKFSNGVEFLPNKLILLCWDGYPSKSMPATFKGEDLVEIQMCNSKLTKLWDGVLNLVSLRKIDLSGSEELIELPNFSKAIHLLEVNLNDCSKLRSVHASIFSLPSLRFLWLSYCEALTSLTRNTHLKSLNELEQGSCSRGSEFSVTSENRGLQLSLSGTAINDKLCSSSGRLNRIESLDLGGCESVTSLHKWVDLRSLRRLAANGCNKLASNLRPIFDEARALEVLMLGYCSELFEVPDNISSLSSLRELHLESTNIETLPLSIKHLSSLEEIYLDDCERLRSLPELPPSISTLFAQNCQSLVTLHLPLTNKGEETYFASFNFTNCMKLDRQSIKAVEAKLLLDLDKAICNQIAVGYPGERVPEWFTYRTTQSSFTVDLPSIPQPWNGSFIFCAVLTQSPALWGPLNAKWFIDGQYFYMSTCYSLLRDPPFSEHVFIWGDLYAKGRVQRQIEEKKRDAQSNTYHPLLHIRFTLENGVIKECGVCLTSTVEYQNYIQQIQFASHPHPNSIAIEVPSRKRKYHSFDEFEEMILSFKALKFNDLPTSTSYIPPIPLKMVCSCFN